MSQKSFDLNKVDVEHFLEVLEVENVNIGMEEANFSCPFPGHQYGDSRPSAYMNLETTAWVCHGCKRHGNAISFLADHENIPRRQAAQFLREEYEPDFREPTGGSMRHELEERFEEKDDEEEFIDYLDLAFLERYEADWEALVDMGVALDEESTAYMFDRGFSAETLVKFDIGYDDTSDRLTIPVFDWDGQLLGFKGRAWKKDHQPKYLILGDRLGRDENRYGYRPYEAKHAVFGMDKAIASGHQGKKLIVVEGEFNVMAMHQMGFTNTVGLGGSNISKRQFDILRQNAGSVVLFFDFDNAGIEATLKAIDGLEPFMPVRYVPQHEGDPADHLKDGNEEYIIECIDGALSSLMTFLLDEEAVE